MVEVGSSHAKGPSSGPAFIIIIIIIIVAFAVNQPVSQSINHRQLSHTIVPGLVIPKSHSDPRAQAGAVRILPVSSTLYLQTAIDKSHHVKRQLLKQRQAGHTTDRQTRETRSSSSSVSCWFAAHNSWPYCTRDTPPNPTYHTHHTPHDSKEDTWFVSAFACILHQSPSSPSASAPAVLPANHRLGRTPLCT